MGQSGTVALKSFQSFQVNDGLLAKVVEAVKAGEKQARSSGDVQSFEVFYRGFRQNIAMGKLYIIPAKIADKLEGFPVALLYGCLVRQFGGEEMADLISRKIGDSEFDEYSDASMEEIKNKLFKNTAGKFETLILFAPEWFNKREYVSFHFTKEDAILADMVRHLVFGAYYDPRLSSAFDSLMTDVSTDKLDVTDITPKLPWPEITQSPLKAFPILHNELAEGTKTAFNRKRLALTVKNADAVKQEVLDPPEASVIDALDLAMTNALGVKTKSVGDAGKEHHDGDNQVPRVASEKEPTEKKFNADAAKAHDVEHKPIGIELNADGTPKRKEATDKIAGQSEIHVANNSQAWLWECELTGQISDGMWENSSPMGHHKGISDAKAVVGGEPGLVNVRPRRTYGFRRLVEHVGDRMLVYGKIGKAYPNLSPENYELRRGFEAILEAKPSAPKAQGAIASDKTAAPVSSENHPNEIVLYSTVGGSDKEYRVQINPAQGGYTVDYRNGPRGKVNSGGTKTSQPVSAQQAQMKAKALVDQKIKEGYRPANEGQDVKKVEGDLQIPATELKRVEAVELATGDDRVEVRHKVESAAYNMGDLMRDLRFLESIVNGGHRAQASGDEETVVKTASVKTASHCNVEGYDECPGDGTDYHGRCLGACPECGEHLMSTGRYTTYCPSCNVCPDCGCPAADGFEHYQGCPELSRLENENNFEEDDDMLVESSGSWQGQIISKKHASSLRSRDRKAAYEKKLEKLRGKVADEDDGSSSKVPDNDDILSEVLSDIGQAPLINLPNDDGNENPSQPSGGGLAALPAASESNTPETEKSVTDAQAQTVPDALETTPSHTNDSEPKQESEDTQHKDGSAKTAAKCKYCEHHVDHAESLERGCCESCAKDRKERGMEPFAKSASRRKTANARSAFLGHSASWNLDWEGILKMADAAPVLPGNLKRPESGNVNAMREALETQAEMEVGKPIEEKQQEVQNAENDLSKEIVLPKDEASSRQVIINIANQKIKATEAKMTRVASNKTAIDYARMKQVAPKLKSQLTRALKQTDVEQRREAVIVACRKAIQEWEAIGAWPDGWHLWQSALDAVRANVSMDKLANEERFGGESTTPGTGAIDASVTNDGGGGAMGGTTIDGHTPLISAVGSEKTARPSEEDLDYYDKHVPHPLNPLNRKEQEPRKNPEEESTQEKEAGFDMWIPGQALREFYPEIQHEIVDYPNANNSPMIEDIDISNGFDKDIAAAADEAMKVGKVAFVSTSPAGGMGIGRDGKSQVLEGAPLRKENDIRGPMFTDEFYQNYDAGPDGSALSIVSRKCAAAEEAAQFTKFLSKVCGEIAATLTAGFKVTSRPLMDKVPGVGEVQLAQVEKAQPGFLNSDMSLVDPASRVKYLLEKLTDSEVQDAINKSFAHAGVWHDESEGGFIYEVFVRGSSIDTDTMIFSYEFVIGTKEAE